MTNLSERLEYLVHSMLGGRWSELAKKTGLSPSTIQQIKDGGDARGNTLLRISTSLNVSLNWLLIGEGDIHLYRSRARTIEEIDKNLKKLTNEQRELIFMATEEMIRLNVIIDKVSSLKRVINSDQSD